MIGNLSEVNSIKNLKNLNRNKQMIIYNDSNDCSSEQKKNYN